MIVLRQLFSVFTSLFGNQAHWRLGLPNMLLSAQGFCADIATKSLSELRPLPTALDWEKPHCGLDDIKSQRHVHLSDLHLQFDQGMASSSSSTLAERAERTSQVEKPLGLHVLILWLKRHGLRTRLEELLRQSHRLRPPFPVSPTT